MKRIFSVRDRSWPARRRSEAPVTVKGWVRTRRDSKAGISFVHCHDGSCFDPMQVVAPNTLPNYADEVLHLTAGCAVAATGDARAVAGQGPAVRDPGERDRGGRLGRRPRHLPDPAKRHTLEFLREVAHLRPRTNTFGAVDARAAHAGAGDPPLLPRARLLLGPHADHHRQRRRGRRARCSACRRSTSPTCRATPEGKVDFAQDFFGTRGVPDRLRPAQRRGVLPGAEQGLHVRPDLPRRELEHQPPPRRVLDDRAGDRVRRPRRQRDLAEALPQVHLRDAARRARRRHGVLRRAHRQGLRRASSRASSTRSSSAWTTPRRSQILERAKAEVRVPGRSGASTCSPSTSAT